MSEKMKNVENTIVLSKEMPDGTKELTLNFDRVNGYALIKCEKEAKKEDAAITVPSLSQVYQAHVASVAAGVKLDDILSLCGVDFTAVTLKTQNFLLNSGK